MWLLIDDMRDLGCDVIARNAEAGKKMLSIGGWECVCFDHDLGAEGESGYDVLQWAFNNNCLPQKIRLVTSNPVGRDRMKSLLIYDAGYTASDGGITFIKG